MEEKREAPRAFEERKRDHLRIALESRNQADGLNGLDRFSLIHEALPEIDLSEVSLSSSCLGRDLGTPFFVSGMTAGHPDAAILNRRMAEACERRGWVFGVGSQRREYEGAADLLSQGIDQWSELRESLPNLCLLGNIGLSQLTRDEDFIANCERLIQRLGANGLCIHLNSLQEALQQEGTPWFRNGLKVLSTLTKELSIPVILKETGCGFSGKTLNRLVELDLSAIDVSGLGGTHWGRIEGRRSDLIAPESPQAEAARTFADWGISTVRSVQEAVKIRKNSSTMERTEIWASGGVRSGLDAAKLIALGADRVGFAQPCLKVAMEGEAVLDRWMATQEFELRVALFCTGYATLPELRESGALIAK